MNYELTVSSQSLQKYEAGLIQRLATIQQPVQGAMAERFFEIVRSNFGDVGVDRPADWAPLSPKYAKRVGRDHATLFVTGRLEAAVKMENTQEAGRVSISDSDVPYATVHQYGGGNNIPARPYFPIDNAGNPTTFTQAQVEDAARDEFQRLIGGIQE